MSRDIGSSNRMEAGPVATLIDVENFQDRDDTSSSESSIDAKFVVTWDQMYQPKVTLTFKKQARKPEE
jgi:hypothetical protein